MTQPQQSKIRKIYGFIAFFTTLFALFVRKVLWAYLPYAINIWIGDFLWAVMLFFAFSAIFITMPIRWRIIIMLIGCCAVETSQLWHTPWLDAFRHTVFGGLLLGHGFLWSDIAANIGGVFFAAALIKTNR